MTSPAADVARDLSAIEAMWPRLVSQAVHAANAPIPGGAATVQLSHVANFREWAEKIDAAEQAHYDDPKRNPWPDLSHEDDSKEPWLSSVLQTLWFWSDELRTTNGQPLEGRRATVASEVRIIRYYLDQLRHTLPEWEDFADDIATARRRLENVLSEGEYAERGVPCMYDECRGARLTRKTKPARGKDGEKVWVISDWRCPRCRRTWTADQYTRMVTAAHEAAKTEEIHGQIWCPIWYAAQRVKRPEATLRVWVHREELPIACVIAGRRARFVPLDVVMELDKTRPRRTCAS